MDRLKIEGRTNTKRGKTVTTNMKLTLAAWMFLAATSLGWAQDNQPAENPPAEMPAFPIMRLDAGGPVSEIRALVFSRDGKTLYAAGLDKMVHAWTMDAAGKFQFAPEKALRIPIGPDISGTINAMAISTDGRYLAVGGQAVGRRFTGFREGGLIFPASTKSEQDLLDTGTIYVFDLNNPAGQPKITHLRGHLGTVILLAFAPTKANQPPILVSAAEEFDKTTGKQLGAVRVWDIHNPEKSIAQNFDLAAPSVLKDNLPRAIAALRTGNEPTDLEVGIAWGDNKLRVWNVARNTTAQFNNTMTIACDGVGNRDLLVGGFDPQKGGHLSLWQPPTQKIIARMGAKTAPIGLATATASNTALVITLKLPAAQGQPRQIGFFLADATKIERLPGNDTEILFGGEVNKDLKRPAFAISSEGNLVAVAGNVDRKIQIFRVNPNQAPAKIQELEGVGDTFPLVRFFRKGPSLGLGLNKAVGNPNNAPELIFDLTASQVADPAGWNPAPAKANISASVGKQGTRTTITLDLGGGNTKTIILPEDQIIDQTQPAQFALCPKTDNHPPLLGVIVKSPVFAESILRVYNAETGERLRQFSGHTDTITSIAFSDDGKLLASAGLDRTVRAWWMEDLKDHIGQHGFLDALLLHDKNDRPTVKEIDEFAAADIKAAFKVDDVIEGFTRPDGTFQSAKKSASFFYYLSMVPPVSEAEAGKANTIKLRIRRDGNILPNDPVVRVQQGVDERKPLFTLFFKDGQAGQKSWIGWTPIGPFDSSDADIERLVGWHFNPPKPAGPLQLSEAPSTYATLAEYNEDHHSEGMFKHLIETGAPPMKEPPALPPDPKEPPPPPKAIRTSLHVHQLPEGPDALAVLLNPDEQQRVWAKSGRLTALFRVTGISSSEIKDSLTWHLDGQKQNFLVIETGGGRFEADLSGFDWKPKPDNASYTLAVSFTEESLSQKYIIQQAIVFAPPPPPAPPKPKKLPVPSIVSPELLTVLYDSKHPREIAIEVRLTRVDEDPVQPGQLTFEINEKPIEKAGEVLVREFDENLAAIKDTLPLSNGRNLIRARLKSADGQERLSESVVVDYKRPPLVKTVTAKADIQNPYAEIHCELVTPEDLPPMDFRIFVNNRLFSVEKDQITKTQDEADKTLWKITAKNVPLSEGANSILFYPRNADSRALTTTQVDLPWAKPPAPPKPRPSRPKIYFSNVNDQVPIAGHWQGDEFQVAFNVLAGAPLKQVLVYYNGQRLDSPAIPEPKDGVKYEFQLPLTLTRTQNQLRVVVRDENTWNEMPITLAPLKPPVTMVIDELFVPSQNLSFQPETAGQGEVTFQEPLPDGRVVLRGRVITSDTSMTFERPFVKCWVNGFLQLARANKNPKKPTEWNFAMRLSLNQDTENSLHLELPEAPKSPFSQTHLTVDCRKPETKQNLRVIALGIDPATLRSLDTPALVKQIETAFRIKNGKNGVFQKVEFYPLKGMVRSAQIMELLERIHNESKPTADRGEHDVVVFYYQGAEALSPKNEIVLRTQDRIADDSAFTKDELKKLLNGMYGAHLMFLDVAEAAGSGDWETGPFLGMVRSVHNGPMPQGDFPLITAIQKALPQTQKLKDLPQQITEAFESQSPKPLVDDRVPKDLERLVVH